MKQQNCIKKRCCNSTGERDSIQNELERMRSALIHISIHGSESDQKIALSAIQSEWRRIDDPAQELVIGDDVLIHGAHHEINDQHDLNSVIADVVAGYSASVLVWLGVSENV